MDYSLRFIALLKDGSRLLLRIIFVSSLLWAVNGNAASWDWLSLYPTQLEAVLKYDRIERQNTGNTSSRSLNTDMEFGINIGQEGYVLDPGIAWFQFDIEPAVTREDVETSTSKEKNSGDNLDYSLQASLLRETTLPVGFDMLIQQNSSTESGSLGSRSDNVLNTKQVSVDWKLEAFPMSLSYREESLDQEFLTSQSNFLSKRDEMLQSWVINGSSSKLRLNLEHKTLDDRISSRDNDFELDEAALSHQLSWGRNSELRTRLDFSDRTGFNANKRLTFEETARIQHTDNVFSRVAYRYFTLTQNTETKEHLTRFELNHKLYRNLTNIARVEIDSSRSDNMNEYIQLAHLDSHYQKQELFGASVNAGLGVSYTDTDRDSTAGLLDIVDESHVTLLGGSVTLNTRFILTSGIVVTNFDGTLVYTQGFDYEINDLVGDLTELQLIPGGQINEGDTILVSYQASVLPSQEFSTLQTRYNIGVDLGWVRFSHQDNRSGNDLLSGADESYLTDTRFTSSNLEFRWGLVNTDILFGLQRSYNLAGSYEATTYTYSQFISWIYSKDSRWNLSASESFTEQAERDNELYSVDISLDWRPVSALFVRPKVGYWQRKITDGTTSGVSSDDEFITAGFTVHWNYRQIVMDFSYYRNERTIQKDSSVTGTESDEERVMFNLTRRFL